MRLEGEGGGRGWREGARLVVMAVASQVKEHAGPETE